MVSSRKLLVTVLTAVSLSVTTALAGCGGSEGESSSGGLDRIPGTWEEVVEAAKQEGSVTIYGAKGGSLPDRLVSAFHEAYPDISAEYIDLSSGEQVERIDQERRAGSLGADVAWNSERAWQDQVSADEALVPADYFGPAAASFSEEELVDSTVLLSGDPIGVMYNTELVDTPPTDWDSLLDEKYRGKVGIVEVIASSLVMYWDFIRDTMGDEFLEQLAALEPQLHGGSATLSQAVASGELAWAIYGNAYTTVPLREQGAPVEIAFPESGTVMLEHDAMVFRDSPHINAGLVFLDFAMSEKGQEVINGGGLAYSQIGVPGSLEIDTAKLQTIKPEHSDPQHSADVRVWFDEYFRG